MLEGRCVDVLYEGASTYIWQHSDVVCAGSNLISQSVQERNRLVRPLKDIYIPSISLVWTEAGSREKNICDEEQKGKHSLSNTLKYSSFRVNKNKFW